MSFTFSNKDGKEITKVWTCTECTYCSTKKHFYDSEDGPLCIRCRSPARPLETITKNNGMSSMKYRELLDWLQENRSGIGKTTVERIQEVFEDGDEFVEVCKDAYESGELDELTEIKGVGEKYAREGIVLGLAEYYGWSSEDSAFVDTREFTLKK